LTLYSTVSRAFPKPETGPIAIKVINHHGDEVMKVRGLTPGSRRLQVGYSRTRGPLSPVQEIPYFIREFLLRG